MTFNLPVHGETPWDTKLNDSINAVKSTADAAETPAGAQAKADAAQSYAVQRVNHTGTQSADTLTDGTTNKAYTAAEKSKLAGVATGATANSTDATLLNRANHTGTQLSSTISDFTSAVQGIAADPQYTVNVVATSGATQTLPASSPAHKITMSANCTFTFSSPTKAGHTFVLLLDGAFTPTFPASVKWGSGAAPTYTTPALYTFTTLDSGTTWLGVQGGKAFA